MAIISQNRISPALVGYCDRLDYRPGDRVDVHIHGDGAVDIDLVALRGADERVAVALPLETRVEQVATQRATASPQASRPGSFALFEGLDDLCGASSVEVELWLQPTALGHAAPQGIVSASDGADRGFALVLAPDDRLELRLGETVILRGDGPILRGPWVHVVARLSPGELACELSYRPQPGLPRGLSASSVRGTLPDGAAVGAVDGRLIVGAGILCRDARGRPFAEQCFNGKIEGVRVGIAAEGAVPAVVAAWDFAQDIGGARVVDVSGNGRHGVLHNAPARAVTGQAWDGDEVDFRRAPEQYAAIHFHDDDLEDAGWQHTASIALPHDLPSGVYAVRVSSTDAEDRIPLFVLPPKGALRPGVAFLAPTFTYQAYANASLGERIDYRGSGISGRDMTPGARDAQLGAHKALQGSLYDIHRDGSGRFYSSQKRPMFNLRPDYTSAVQQAPRHLGADLYLTGWLTHRGYAYDVLTDHVLDREPDVLDGYKVVVTGSHPEYWSGRMLSALETFIGVGGRVMYLGGNGFYWVTSQDPARPHMIECRRGHAGIRTWTSEPGEVHLGTTGEPGGLWRHRGRAPNRLVGIGMASQGWDERAPGFRRSPDSRDPAWSWVFDGVESETFGEQGLVMDGASGDELDRYDASLGSPVHARVLATSFPHSRYYKLVVEDVPMIVDGLGGDTDERVRSDVVLFDWPSGGAVFSVGSISWAGALAWNDFDNPVERVTRNVLDRFLTADSSNLLSGN